MHEELVRQLEAPWRELNAAAERYVRETKNTVVRDD